MVRQLRLNYWIVVTTLSVFSLAELPGDGFQYSAAQDTAAFHTTSSPYPPTASIDSGNSLSQGIVKSTLQDPNTVQYNAENDSNGREYKAADARNTANKGNGVAIAMGSTFVATAIPMLASINPIVRAAGADLMAKGALEFAQAAADKQSSKANDSQNKLLRQTASQEGKEATANNNGINPASIATPELTQLLESKGLDPVAFTTQLANGGFGNAPDVLKALGEDTGLNSEELEKANTLSAQMTGNIFATAEKNLSKELASVKYEDQGAPVKSSQENSNNSITGSVNQTETNLSLDNSKGQANPTEIAANENKTNLVLAGIAESGLSDLEALKGLLAAGVSTKGASKNTTERNPYASYSEAELRKSGIIGKGSGNIFQIATGSYKSFSKWRNSRRKFAAR